MNILVIGGTRYFGIHMVRSLLNRGHNVTIATRGITNVNFGDEVERVVINRTSSNSISKTLGHRYFDVVCDNIAYCSNDIKASLDNIQCERYVLTSSVSVYASFHFDIKENEFDSMSHPLEWCSREDYPYDEIKRQSECALFQAYPQMKAVAVRLPYVVGEDDYTQRLYFYIEQIMKGNPLDIDNLDEEISFIHSEEAGKFIAWVAEQTFLGPVNGYNPGTISLREVFHYVEHKTGRKAVLNSQGLKGPYNGTESYSLDISKAIEAGYDFMDLRGWIFELLNNYIRKAKLA